MSFSRPSLAVSLISMAFLGLAIGLFVPVGRSKQTVPQVIRIDGSSTVFPITQAAVDAYNQEQSEPLSVKVNVSGTSGGFRRFCAGEIDISDASRPINQAEMQACNQAGVRFYELPIAFDALTVVVNPQNTWANDISLDELKRIWEPAATGKINNWKQVRATYPDKPLRLFGPGRDSGTFDYFTEVTVGKSASRSDYVASEDDQTLVQGVAQDPNALGYFGFAYYEENSDKLKALAITNQTGTVAPSRESVEKAQYQPMARPLFIYVNYQSLADKPDLVQFVDFYVKNGRRLVETVGYIPLPDEAYHIARVQFTTGKVGTAFDGQPQKNLTIAELLRQQKTF